MKLYRDKARGLVYQFKEGARVPAHLEEVTAESAREAQSAPEKVQTKAARPKNKAIG